LQLEEKSEVKKRWIGGKEAGARHAPVFTEPFGSKRRSEKSGRRSSFLEIREFPCTCKDESSEAAQLRYIWEKIPNRGGGIEAEESTEPRSHSTFMFEWKTPPGLTARWCTIATNVAA